MHPFDSRTVPGHTARMLIGLCICTHTQAQSNEWKAQRENAQRHEREWASTSDDFQWKWDSSRRMPTAALLCTRQLGQKNEKCSKKAHTSTKVDGHRPSKTFEENSAGRAGIQPPTLTAGLKSKHRLSQRARIEASECTKARRGLGIDLGRLPRVFSGAGPRTGHMLSAQHAISAKWSSGLRETIGKRECGSGRLPTLRPEDRAGSTNIQRSRLADLEHCFLERFPNVQRVSLSLPKKSDLWLVFAEYYLIKNSSHFAWEKSDYKVIIMPSAEPHPDVILGG